MRLIGDGAIEREGVAGLARRVGYSERHLTRLLTDELGAGPLAIARAQRAHTARTLIETTAMSFTDVAFAAGFGSIRQFNDTIRMVFAASPTQLRAARPSQPGAASVRGAGAVRLRFPVRQPFSGASVLGFLGAHVVAGVEHWDGEVYGQVLNVDHGHGVARVSATPDGLDARLALDDWRDLTSAVHRLRRQFDLDADPVAVSERLCEDPILAPLVAAEPGRRAPASVDPFEAAVRAVIGQQVSIAGGATVTSRLVDAVGTPINPQLAGLVGLSGDLATAFPAPSQLAEAPDDAYSMPSARRDTVRRLATAVAEGTVVLDAGVDIEQTRSALGQLKGIGPWTIDMITLRGFGHPDVFIGTDLVARRALERFGLTAEHSAVWAPWRSYALHHLWAAIGTFGVQPTISSPTKGPAT